MLSDEVADLAPSFGFVPLTPSKREKWVERSGQKHGYDAQSTA
jgi:hypothetical protein